MTTVVPSVISQITGSKTGKAMVQVYGRPVGYAYYPWPGQAIHFDSAGHVVLWDLDDFLGGAR